MCHLAAALSAMPYLSVGRALKMPHYSIKFFDDANAVVRVVQVEALSRAKVFVPGIEEGWPLDAVSACVFDKHGRNGPSVSRPQAKANTKIQGVNEDEFVAQWRERLASNPRFTQDKRTGGGITLPGAQPTTPMPAPEPMPKLTPEEAKLLACIERALGRTLDKGETKQALEQTRAFGELWKEASARRHKLGR